MTRHIASNPTVQVPLQQIVVSKANVRSSRNQDSIDNLAGSMGSIGQIYPVLLHRIKDEKYEVIAGSRRLGAAWKAGRETITATILEDISDPDMIVLSLAENLHREDLTPFEQAEAILKLCKDYGIEPKEVAKKIHRPLAFVTGRLKILSVPDKVRELLDKKEVALSHIGILASLHRPQDQIRYAKIVAKQVLSEGDLVTLIRDEVKTKDGAQPERPAAVKLFTPMRVALKIRRFSRFLYSKVRPQMALEGSEVSSIRKALRETRNMINELLARH